MRGIVPGAVSVFGVSLTLNKVVAASVAIVVMCLVAWFFRFTPFGVAMRASAEDHVAEVVPSFRTV